MQCSFTQSNCRPVAAERRRAGLALAEVLVAGMLLGAVMAISLPALSWVLQERRAAERRQQATLEVENLMERLTALGWEAATPEAAAKLQLSEEVRQQLPAALLACVVDGKPDAPEAKRIHIELSWANRTNQPVAPVRLTTWIYRSGGQP